MCRTNSKVADPAKNSATSKYYVLIHLQIVKLLFTGKTCNVKINKIIFFFFYNILFWNRMAVMYVVNCVSTLDGMLYVNLSTSLILYIDGTSYYNTYIIRCYKIMRYSDDPPKSLSWNNDWSYNKYLNARDTYILLLYRRWMLTQLTGCNRRPSRIDKGGTYIFKPPISRKKSVRYQLNDYIEKDFDKKIWTDRWTVKLAHFKCKYIFDLRTAECWNLENQNISIRLGN